VSLSIGIAKGDYQGDPGLFSVIGKVAKGLGKVGGKILKTVGGPVGGIVTAGVGLLGSQIFKKAKGKSTFGAMQLPTGQLQLPTFAEPQQQPMPGTGVQVQFPRLPFGLGGGGLEVGQFQQPQGQFVQPGKPTGTQLCTLPGGAVVARPTHANKSGYYIRSGQTTGTYVPPGSRCVTNRRMNPLNPRALHHAMTRIVSAKRAAKFLGRISIRSGCAPKMRRAASRHGAGCACKTCR